MTQITWCDLATIEEKVCDLTSHQMGIRRDKVKPESRLTQDLGIDSLDAVELIMEMEEQFDATLPSESTEPLGKAIFARDPFRIRDLAELVYVAQGTGAPKRKRWQGRGHDTISPAEIPFSQLGGRWQPINGKKMEALFEQAEQLTNARQFRRRTDGMRCVLIEPAIASIGSDDLESCSDERPQHNVQLDAYLIDAEPVSTTAWCRFLNSITPIEAELRDWFVLADDEHRSGQMPVECKDGTWRPVSGCELIPMVLVSWFGANAYSLWANGEPWSDYRTHAGYLPTEAQWEHAAAGAVETNFVSGQHAIGQTYEADTMPMAPVHAPMGVSKFGLHHMAGNVWQWCRDWYDPKFYSAESANQPNAVNDEPTGIRSERGGSWVGPAELCRPTTRRGRAPDARGRCLGFRCVSVPL